MIRKYKSADEQKIIDLWLEASLQAHPFVADDYWREMQASVRDYYLPNTDTFVFEDKHKIKGFISVLDGSYIGALFVAPQHQGHKTGSKLLKFVQKRYPLLSLNVFVKNPRAINFYQRNGFKIIAEQTDPSTKEAELRMSWGLGCKSGFAKSYYADS